MKHNAPTASSGTPLTYKDAGVDIEAGNELVTRIKSSAQQTLRPEVLTGLGGFGGLFKIPKGYDEPVLVSGTDGVGTKLRLALDLNQHSTVGIDLVAMCVNDIIVSGAEPLYFLDYFATSSLDVERAADVIKGIAKGCSLAGCALLGGETAEMPGMYMDKDYDLAGFCVGIVEQRDIIDGSKIKPGHKIIGLKSSGPHSNGFSLIRKIIDIGNTELHTLLGERSLGEHLIEPTRIYTTSILNLMKQVDVLGLAHITGGGLLENIPRVLPKDTKAIIDSNTWNWQKIFYWLQHHGNVAEEEMYRTFNCGIGMAIVVSADHVEPALAILQDAGESAVVIGEISQRQGQEPQVDIIGKK